MTGKEGEWECNTKILNEIDRQFEYAEKTKNKIYFMRYDIRFPQGYGDADNGVFREFQSKFMKNLSNKESAADRRPNIGGLAAATSSPQGDATSAAQAAPTSAAQAAPTSAAQAAQPRRRKADNASF